MRNSVRASFFTACVLAANELISGPGATLASEPAAQETTSPNYYKQLKAHFEICDPRAVKFTLTVFQTMALRHPKEVPQEVYSGVREIFRASAREMYEYTKNITATPMENGELSAALRMKYDQLESEHRNKLNALFEKWPAPYSFNVEEFGRIDLQLDADSRPLACANMEKSL